MFALEDLQANAQTIKQAALLIDFAITD